MERIDDDYLMTEPVGIFQEGPFTWYAILPKRLEWVGDRITLRSFEGLRPTKEEG